MLASPLRFLGTVPFVLMCGPLTVGCSGKPKPHVTESAKEIRNLVYIGRSYVDACQGLGRPPKKLEELKPYMEGLGDLNDILTSPNDGLPYGIVWDTKPGRAPIAYEQKGKDGKRMVVDTSLMPFSVTEEAFSRYKLPAPKS